jgi:hypothetical protein
MGSTSAPDATLGLLLEGAVVQRADVSERMVALKVRAPGATSFVVATAGAVGVVEGRMVRPLGARRLAALEGFRVAWVGARSVALARLDPEGGILRARVDARQDGRVEVHVGQATWTDAEEAEAAREVARSEWLARGAGLVEGHAASDLAARREEARRAMKAAVARVARRIEAVRGDLARIGEADGLAARAQWLVAEASRAPPGATSLKVVDWSSGEAQTIEVPLDPAKPARTQVDAMFMRARRLKLGAKVAGERLALAEKALAALRAVEPAIAEAEDAAAIDALLARARSASPKDVKLPGATATRGGKGRQEKAPPYRTFHARSGARILVGRGAEKNDALTFQVARPHDLWLHAKDRAGAHVVVPLPKTGACDGALLADAAHLAAHFSDARDEAVVDVQYASRRHLRKPRGSAPGLVIVDREKVITVRVEPAVLRALLESEEA